MPVARRLLGDMFTKPTLHEILLDLGGTLISFLMNLMFKLARGVLHPTSLSHMLVPTHINTWPGQARS